MSEKPQVLLVDTSTISRLIDVGGGSNCHYYLSTRHVAQKVADAFIANGGIYDPSTNSYSGPPEA